MNLYHGTITQFGVAMEQFLECSPNIRYKGSLQVSIPVSQPLGGGGGGQNALTVNSDSLAITKL